MKITRVPDPNKADGMPVLNGLLSIPIVSQSVSIVCHQDTPEFSPLTVDGFIANSSTLASFGKLIGVTASAVLANQEADVVVTGRLENNVWSWTEGDLILLSGSDLASSAPGAGYVQQIGFADTPTSVVVVVRPPILL